MNWRNLVKSKYLPLLVLLFVILAFAFSGKGDSIDIKEEGDAMSFSFSSGDSFQIRYDDIQSVSEVKNLDLGQMITGVDTKQYQFGLWESDRFGNYHLGVYTRVSDYIVIETASGDFVINMESKDATHSFYQAFLELLARKSIILPAQ